MADVKKFKETSKIFQHMTREVRNPGNKEIDRTRTHLNYFLTKDADTNEKALEKYKKRKSELYCFNRKDVVTLASWIITAPEELTTKAEEDAFFKGCFDFMSNRYGLNNSIQASVHYDEGITEIKRDPWTHKPYLDEQGKPIREVVMGRPHLHFCFIPVVKDTKKVHNWKGYSEKICANDVINRTELMCFHRELQKYLDDNHIKGKVITGITKKNGKNYTVDELKEKTKLKNKVKYYEKKYGQQIELEYENGEL